MLGMDIRSFRKSRDLSQSALADLLGVTQSTISRFERGDLQVDARTMLALDAIAAKVPEATPAAAPVQ